MKNENVKNAVELIDDELVKEASKGKKISFKAVAAGVLAVAVVFAALGVARNTPAALISGIEKQAEAVVTAANEMDDYSDGEETVMFVEEEISLLVALSAGVDEEENHLTPAKDAVEKYRAELEELKERAKASLEAFKEAAKEYKEGERKLTREQRKALREKGTSIRARVKEAGKARRIVTAKEIVKARRNGDTDRLNEIYADICTSIETGMEKLNSALDRLDELTEKLA